VVSQTQKQRLDSIVAPNINKQVFSYDSKGNNTLSIGYTWKYAGSDWEGYEKSEYTYDSKNNQILEIYYEWKNNIWVKSSKCEYTYDDNGNRILDIYYIMDYANNWTKYSKYEYTYDDKGNRTLYIYYQWANAINDWREEHKYEYTYNLSYSKTDLICPADYLTNNMRTEEKRYSWLGNRDNTYYWSTFSVGIVGANAICPIQVYPNPAGNQLIINNGELIIENIEIYNVMGQMVQSKIVNLQSEIVIDVSHLANGMYFLKVDGKVVRFVKE
jgi:hypothetical protein